MRLYSEVSQAQKRKEANQTLPSIAMSTALALVPQEAPVVALPDAANGPVAEHDNPSGDEDEVDFDSCFWESKAATNDPAASLACVMASNPFFSKTEDWATASKLD